MHDPATAAWAAQQALRACPYDERLHRVLMRTADALGNRAGVESTLRQLAMILEIEGNPLAGVHPDTAALYESLTQGS
jgi:DNA-binding SARP family transcriptional activator